MLKRSILGVGAAVLLALPAVAQSQQMPMAEAPEGKHATITGTVIDLSCRFRFNLTGEQHRMCAQVCADNGIPLAILTSDGTLYVPISDGMPGNSQNAALREYAEQQVSITGMVYDAGGAKGIVIGEIKQS